MANHNSSCTLVYNSSSAHQGEGNAMIVVMKSTLYAVKVDIMFAGHVHAYECAVSYSNLYKAGNFS